jgi:hypothetical protein
MIKLPQTLHYKIAVIDVGERGDLKNAYGIVNKETGVVEHVHRHLPDAIVHLASFQKALVEVMPELTGKIVPFIKEVV